MSKTPHEQAGKVTGAERLEWLRSEALPCRYVRFHQPVPPGYDKEPVSEFRVHSKNKYSIEDMRYHQTAGLFFTAINKRGEEEQGLVAGANVIYVRF